MLKLLSLCQIIASLFILLVMPAMSQNDSSKSPKVSFRVTRFDPADGASPMFLVGSERIECEVPLTSIEGPFKATLRDGVHLDFWIEGKDQPEISIAIAENERKDLLLIFFPDGKTFRVLKVVTSPDQIGGGDRMIINTSPDEIGVKLGTAEPVVIMPGKSGILKTPVAANNGTLPAVVNVKREGKWTLVSTEDWPSEPSVRKFLFAYVSPRTRHLIFHTVSELVE
jgi:hypothetical protein